MLGAGCATANQMLLARLLSPEALAAYFLIQSVVIVGAQLGQLGLSRPLTRLIAVAAGTGEGNRIPGLLSAAHLLAARAARPHPSIILNFRPRLQTNIGVNIGVRRTHSTHLHANVSNVYV